MSHFIRIHYDHELGKTGNISFRHTLRRSQIK